MMLMNYLVWLISSAFYRKGLRLLAYELSVEAEKVCLH